METSWADALVTVTREGRRYDLHYVGPNLRMVVLREPGGTSYWVVNTLQNKLSNETMLAIARSRDYALVATRTIHDQAGRFQVDYRLPSGLLFDVGAGVMATSQVGVGFSLAGSVQEDTALVNVEIPHPILSAVPGTAAGATERM